MLQENDTSFISDEQVLRYVGQLAVYNGSHRPNAAFEYSGKKLKGFLMRVLKFNPLVRPTAAELLADPIFDKVRDPRLEELSSPENLYGNFFHSIFQPQEGSRGGGYPLSLPASCFLRHLSTPATACEASFDIAHGV